MGHETLTKKDIEFLKGTLQVDIHRYTEKLEEFDGTTYGTLTHRIITKHINNCEKMIKKLDNLTEFPEL